MNPVAIRRCWRRWRTPVLGLVAAAALSGCSNPARATGGPPLDLSPYRMTFDETFRTPDVGTGPGALWSVHTPWHGDFGDARFVEPGPDGPFSYHDGLHIRAWRGPDGTWRSGLICSVDKDGPGQKGFAQRYGYFEMRAKLPSGMGVWAAFWLIGTQKATSAAEIDVAEFYGGFPGYYHTVAHLWVDGRDQMHDDGMVAVPPGSLSSSFNNYGVLIEPLRTTFYLNRRAVRSIATPPEYRQPMYLLANLALGGGWPIDGLSSPKVMDIEWIRAFTRPDLQGRDGRPGEAHGG